MSPPGSSTVNHLVTHNPWTLVTNNNKSKNRAALDAALPWSQAERMTVGDKMSERENGMFGESDSRGGGGGHNRDNRRA